MPCNVAVEGPRAWVVGIVLQNNVSRVRCRATLDQLYVATLGILRMSNDTVPGSCSLSEHIEVMPVKMHGVGGYEFIVDYKAHGGIGAEVVDIPIGGIGEIACVRKRKNGVAVE